MKILWNLHMIKVSALSSHMFRFPAPECFVALFDASLFDFSKDRSGDPFFWHWQVFMPV
jgi:hypothetical protein